LLLTGLGSLMCFLLVVVVEARLLLSKPEAEAAAATYRTLIYF